MATGEVRLVYCHNLVTVPSLMTGKHGSKDRAGVLIGVCNMCANHYVLAVS